MVHDPHDGLSPKAILQFAFVRPLRLLPLSWSLRRQESETVLLRLGELRDARGTHVLARVGVRAGVLEAHLTGTARLGLESGVCI